MLLGGVGWARRRSFVALLLWMTAKYGLGFRTGRLEEADRAVAASDGLSGGFVVVGWALEHG
jgi:hypothetical protein